MIIEYFEITFKKPVKTQRKADKHKIEIQVISSFLLSVVMPYDYRQKQTFY